MPLTAISLQKVKRHVGGFGTPVGHNESHYPQMEKNMEQWLNLLRREWSTKNYFRIHINDSSSRSKMNPEKDLKH